MPTESPTKRTTADELLALPSGHFRYELIRGELKKMAPAGGEHGMIAIVNPRRRAVTVYRSRSDITVLTEEDTLGGGDVVPGWSVPVRDVFA